MNNMPDWMPPEYIPWILAYIFFTGACLGSFLNVCIYRIPEDLSVIKPRSRCPKCKKNIAWYDNLPILSWLLLHGKCRGCQTSISPRYLLVELLTAVLFTLTFYLYGLSWLTPIYWLLVFGLLLATFVDFDHMIIPDRVSLGGILIGWILSPLVPEMHGYGLSERGPAFVASFSGACVGWGILWLVAALGKLAFKKDAMGFGDVKLMGAIGAFLGWKAVVFTLFMSSLIGSVAGLSIIMLGKREWQTRIPYGPYIALAALAWVFGGYELFAWYLRWSFGPVGP